ncbi:MAG: hypothetical protein AB7U73_02065 [Pirellulales bacterium]
MTSQAKSRWLAVGFTELLVMGCLLAGLTTGVVYSWQGNEPVYVGPGADARLLALDLGTARDWSMASDRTYTVRFERNDEGRVDRYVVECELQQAGPPIVLLRRKMAPGIDVACSRLIIEFLADNKTANAARLEVLNHRTQRRWTILVDSPASGIVLQKA